MSDLISRQDAIDHFRSLPYNNGLYTDEEVVHELSRIPTATERKGEWIEVNVKGMDYVYCSECEDSYYPVPLDPSWNFCPNCGADMRGKRCVRYVQTIDLN